MRRLPFLWLATAALAVAQDKPLTTLPYTPSLDTKFMDRAADPCTNFYQYACGNWNKMNPIPPDQARWDVYSKLANENERLLWSILEAAAKPSASRTGNEQRIGDFFHACMDEASVERAGAKPIAAALEQIAKLGSTGDIAAFIASEHTNGFESGMLFGFGSNQDFDNSSQVIAFAGAGGLGLPDRDYYTKTDAKSQEIRQRYVAHIQAMLELIGESAPEAQAEAQTIMQMETALAQASLTRVQTRDPYNLKHKVTREQLSQMVPQFNWDSYFAGIQAPQFQTVNVTQPRFYDQLNQQLQQRNLAAWRAYLRWHTVHAAAPYLSSNFVQEHFNFYGRYL
ncbi:MAG TPA: M13 family metallopeptidase N-terminal domain-containing protein, partial [Bryobacteraceae bacterium]